MTLHDIHSWSERTKCQRQTSKFHLQRRSSRLCSAVFTAACERAPWACRVIVTEHVVEFQSQHILPRWRFLSECCEATPMLCCALPLIHTILDKMTNCCAWHLIFVPSVPCLSAWDNIRFILCSVVFSIICPEHKFKSIIGILDSWQNAWTTSSVLLQLGSHFHNFYHYLSHWTN